MSSPINGLPSYDDQSPNFPPMHFNAWAAVLDSRLIARFATTTARDSAITAPVNGMVAWCDSPGAFYDRVGGAWLRRDQVAYVKAGQSADLAQPASAWVTIPTATLTVEGPTGVFSTATKNNAAYVSHPARNVLIIGKAGLYTFEANATFDVVNVNLRLIRNPEGPIEVFAVSVAASNSGTASCSTTRRCAAGDAIAIQSYHTVTYIAKADGATTGTPASIVSTNITATRIGA